MKQKFKFLEHTADIKFQAFGNSIEEVFENSALAMFNAMFDGKVAGKKKKRIQVKGKDLENLMYNFLEELLFLFDSEGFFVAGVENLEIFREISDKKKIINKKKIVGGVNNSNDKGEGIMKLTADIIGDKAENYKISVDVKAVTYNEMFVRKEKDKFVAQVVVDV